MEREMIYERYLFMKKLLMLSASVFEIPLIQAAQESETNSSFTAITIKLSASWLLIKSDKHITFNPLKEFSLRWPSE